MAPTKNKTILLGVAFVVFAVFPGFISLAATAGSGQANPPSLWSNILSGIQNFFSSLTTSNGMSGMSMDQTSQLANAMMVMGPATNVSPAGSFPVWLMYHSEDSPGGMIPASTAPLKEWVEDLAANPTLTATSGNWSQIWNASTTPGASDVVMIPAGVTVTYDLATTGPTVKTIGVKGTFVFDPTKNLQISVGTIFVYPGGSLIVKPNANVKHEIVISGTVNTAEDPGQFALGIVAVGGIVDIEGSNNPTSFMHYTSAEAGQNTITLASVPQNWNAGDQLVIAGNIISTTGSTFGDGSSVINEERVTIQSISGTVVTLTAPLQYTHHLLVDHGIVYQRVPGVVGHITRNVYIHSANVNNLMSRGQIMVMDQTVATVKNVELFGMGRTTNNPENDTKRDSSGNLISIGANPRGRYPLHAHHVTVPFDFENNAIVNEQNLQLRWGMVSHNSYGTMKNNIVVWKGGSGIVSEYGTETGPIIGNAVIGLGGGIIDPLIPWMGEDDGARTNSVGTRLSVYDFGEGGFGYWLGSRTNEVSNNVADGLFNVTAFDYYLDWYGRGNEQPVTRPDNVPDELPYSQQAPLDQYGGAANLPGTPNRLFEGNTNYAHNDGQGALRNEWDASFGSIIRNFTSYDGGIGPNGGGENKENILDNVKLFGLGVNPGTGVARNDRVQSWHIINSDIENFSTGVESDGELLDLRNTKIVNASIPVQEVNDSLQRQLLPALPPVYKDGYSEISNPNGSNQPPTVSLVNLDRDSQFNTQSTVTLRAVANDPDGAITNVIFYNTEKVLDTGNFQLGADTYNLWNAGNQIGVGTLSNGVWTFNWTNPSAGKYKISVAAFDSAGAVTVTGNIPIEVLPGSLATPVFYRAIDFGASASSMINGHLWEPGTTNNYDPNYDPSTNNCINGNPGYCASQGARFNVPPEPSTDAATQAMAESGFGYFWPSADPIPPGFAITNVPTGTYEVYLYNAVSANNTSFFSVVVQGVIEKNMQSLPRAGMWSKLGPYTATVDSSGRITVQYFFPLREGFPPFVSGIEIYKLQSGGTLNEPPHVTASVNAIDRSNPIVVSASLTGTVTDTTIGNDTYYWKLFRGPADVYFNNKTGLTTNVQFFRTGTYELQLVATNGQYTTESNIVTVDVPSMPTVFSSSANAAVAGETFYRGYHMGDSSVTINGNFWQGRSSPDVSTFGDDLATPSTYALSTTLYPNDSNVADSNFASMLRTGISRQGVTIRNIPSGNYTMYAYVVDSGDNEWADFWLNGQAVIRDVITNSNFGPGSWRKIGPYTIPIADGTLTLDSYGSYSGAGYPIAGIELWRANGAVTTFAPNISSFVAAPTGITQGSSTTLSWSVSGNPAPTISINNGVGSVFGSSITVTPNASTTYTLTATNSAGSATANVTVTILPPPDFVPPTTSITAPPLSATVSSTITVTANASDNVSVTKVELWIDGVIAGTDSASPYTFSVNTLSLVNGPHVLQTKAYDAAGNIGNSTNLLVTVANPGGGTPAPIIPAPSPSASGGTNGGGFNPPSLGGVSSSTSIVDLKALLASLIAKVKALIAQLNHQLTQSFTRNLTVGSYGPDVRNLQAFLNINGYPITASGLGSPGNEVLYFGQKTAQALAKYQAAHGLPATGFLGAKTRAYLMQVW